jgi:hypothetical protein
MAEQEPVVQEIQEKPVAGQRLGRHVEHDPRSRGFQVSAPPVLKDARHERHCPSFDQGNLGSCTGNAMAGALMTEPFFKDGRSLQESDAVSLYTRATHLDRLPGIYPPDDTGSSGLAVAKAARESGYITAYQHAFGLQQALGALVDGPAIAGVNWYDSFDNPNADGECPLTPTAQCRGGHEIQLFGIEVEAKRVWVYQSWGPEWGGLKNGTFWFSWDTFDRLLHEQGDVTTFS